MVGFQIRKFGFLLRFFRGIGFLIGNHVKGLTSRESEFPAQFSETQLCSLMG